MVGVLRVLAFGAVLTVVSSLMSIGILHLLGVM